ncbi:MAG: hypothetical protein EB127_18005 [Alphaproteobacteria bacterium]|nr:hypothetical protein [Alphaproteobacteria bacterium]
MTGFNTFTLNIFLILPLTGQIISISFSTISSILGSAVLVFFCLVLFFIFFFFLGFFFLVFFTVSILPLLSVVWLLNMILLI